MWHKGSFKMDFNGKLFKTRHDLPPLPSSSSFTSFLCIFFIFVSGNERGFEVVMEGNNNNGSSNHRCWEFHRAVDFPPLYRHKPLSDVETMAGSDECSVAGNCLRIITDNKTFTSAKVTLMANASVCECGWSSTALACFVKLVLLTHS
jgi:hypothetical protein